MFLELIATIFAGIAGAGVTLLVNRLLGGRLPRWLTPVMAGAAMLFATISSEYSWYGRTAASLPEGLVIAAEVEDTAIYRPWTYLVPFVSRFLAVDMHSAQQNTQDPALWLSDVYFYGRWRPLQMVQVMVNCDTGQQAVPRADGGQPVWQRAEADDPIVRTICEG